MTANEKRLVTVTGTLLAVVAVVVLVLVPYVRKWQFYDKTIDQRQTRIHNLKRQVANKPALLQEIELMDSLMDSSNLFIRAADKTAASGALLSAVKKIAEEAGGEIASINILDKRKTASNTVAINLNLTIDNAGLVDVLKDLSASKPLLNVTKARIVPLLKRKGNRASDTGKVRLVLTVEAFFAVGEAS